MYNTQNIFYKILKSEIPNKTIYEDENILCFYDINPKSKIHALVIPKMNYIDFNDFVTNANPTLVSNFFKKVNDIAVDILFLENFKIITNNGAGAGQEVFHFHVHILG